MNAIHQIRKTLSLNLNQKLFNNTLIPAFFSLNLLIISFTYGAYRYFQNIRDGGDPWLSGDWLINYQGGFVRRGVVGEILLSVTPKGQNSLWILFVIQFLICFILLMYFIFQLAIKNFSWNSVAIYCNPAGIAFIGWDPYGFGRKEYLGILVLVLLSLFFFCQSYKYWIIQLILVNFLFIFSIFGSEINFVFLPMFLYIQSLYLVNSKYSKPVSVFTITLSFLTLFFCLLHKGNSEQSAQVCDGIKKHGLNSKLCEGAISYIGNTLESQITMVKMQYPIYVMFFVLLVFALIPLLITDWGEKNRKLIIKCLLVSIPLYVVAIDYGRWISMLFIGLTICSSNNSNIERKISKLNPLIVVLYVSIWKLPHSGMDYLEIFKGFFYFIGRSISVFVL